VMLVIVSLDLKHTEPTFSPSPIDSLCLGVAQVPMSQDMAIFVSTDDRQTAQCFTPAAHACTRGNHDRDLASSG
jgi:hypothetical protein